MEPGPSASPAQVPETSSQGNFSGETEEDLDIEVAELLELYKRIPPPHLRAYALHTARERVVGSAIRKVKDDGIFDSFRKAWLKDLETKPQFQNLIRRVELRCTEYLTTLKWSPDMNKAQLREQLQNFANRGPFVDGGIRDLLQEFHTGHYANPIPKQRFEEAVTRIVSETVQRYIQTATPSFPRLKSNRNSDLDDTVGNPYSSTDFSDFDFSYFNQNEEANFFGEPSVRGGVRSKSPDVVDMEISSPESGSSPNQFSPPPPPKERLKQNGWEEPSVTGEEKNSETNDDLQGALGLLMLAGDWGQFGEDTEDSEESQSAEIPPPPPPEMSIPLPPSLEPPSPPSAPPPPGDVEDPESVDKKVSSTDLSLGGILKIEPGEDFGEETPAVECVPPSVPSFPLGVDVEVKSEPVFETDEEEVKKSEILDQEEGNSGVVQVRATSSIEPVVQVPTESGLMAKPVLVESTSAGEVDANSAVEVEVLRKLETRSGQMVQLSAGNEDGKSELTEPLTPPTAAACTDEETKHVSKKWEKKFPTKRKSSVSSGTATKKPVQVMRIDPPLRPDLGRARSSVVGASTVAPPSRSRKSEPIPRTEPIPRIEPAPQAEPVVSLESASRPTRNRKSNSKYSNDNFVLVPTSIPKPVKRPVSTTVKKPTKGDLLSQSVAKQSSVESSPISLNETLGDSTSVSSNDASSRKTVSSKKKKV